MVNLYNAKNRELIKENVKTKDELLTVLEQNNHLEELAVFGVLNGVVYQGLFTIDEAKESME
jgi:hypothetical protein